MTKISQLDLVLDYMKQHKRGITSWEAIKYFGCTRLSSVIYNLKKRGYNIGREMIYSRNRYDNSVGFARYYLDDNKEKLSFFERLRFFM